MVSLAKDARRIAAMQSGEKTWNGPECKKDGTVERWVSTGGCVECSRKRSREYWRKKAATPEAMAEKERRAAKKAAAKHYRGESCHIEGHGDLRYKKGDGCVACARVRAENAKRKKAGLPIIALPRKPMRASVRDDSRRLAAEAGGFNKWDGEECPRCSTTTRYVLFPYACVECKARANSKIVWPKKSDDPKWVARRLYRRAVSAEVKIIQDRESWRRKRERMKNDPIALEKHRTMLRKSRAKSYANNPERREAKRVYDRENKKALTPEQKRAYRQTRRAREANAEGSHTPDDIRALAEAQGGQCAYCDSPWEHVDHKTPLSRGGSNWPENLQLLCGFHNISKGAKTDEEYRAILDEISVANATKAA